MTLFTDKAPGIMMLLMKDFDLDQEGAAAILGNLGTESGGFKYSQEIKPIGNGRGGLGWAQWTGPRRKTFEAYCKRNNYDVTSDKANYGYLWVELTGEYKNSIVAVKNAEGLYNKMTAFEKSFEKAGVKNYASRYKYAQEALEAYLKVPKSTEVPVLPQEPVPQPTQPSTSVPSPTPVSRSWFITILRWIFLGHS